MGMVVKTKEDPSGVRKCMGYYGHKRRFPGDEFELEHSSHFSERWMEKVSGKGSVSVGIDLKQKEK